MAEEVNTSAASVMAPPRSEVGVTGWMRANLFSTWYNALMTVVSVLVVVWFLWFGLTWVFGEAEWRVIGTLGGQFIIGQYNTAQACPGQDCFWRPQVGLLLATIVLGMAWGVAGGGTAKRVALAVAIVAAALSLIPYSFERMGMDVRILLVANIPAVFLGLAITRYTPWREIRHVAIVGVISFLLTIFLLRGFEGIPGLQPVSVIHWGGLMLNILLAVAGIVLSLPIGIALALGRRSQLPVVKLLCVVFIEIFRGVPLITLLFMSQVLVPLAFPEDFPQNSLFRAAVVITLFSSAYMAENIRGGLQALHPGQAEAARALGAVGLADHVPDLPSAGHPQRDTRHRGTVHRSLQGHQPCLHHRDAGRRGDRPRVHPGQPGVSPQRAGAVHLPRHRILDIHVRNVVREQACGGPPACGRAVGVRA